MGYYQPARVLTNDELAAMVDTSDTWIRTRVGIETRHIAADGETVDDMAAAAVEKALANGGIEAASVDLVVVATCTAEHRSPNMAARVAARLGMEAPAVYDLNTVCAGFCYALATADHAIRAGAARTAVVVGSEKFSAVTDWTDRTTCVLVGDGAGAVVLSACEPGEEPGIGPVVWGSVPQLGSAVRIEHTPPVFSQDGLSVFRWATTALAPIAAQASRAFGVEPENLDAFVPHQANLRIIEPMGKALGLPVEKVARDVRYSGNTSAASVPLALAKRAEAGELPTGSLALLFGFGGGLAYAGQVIACP